MRRLTTIAQVREAVSRLRAAGQKIALVPTMGALHDGHLTLVRHAARVADAVVVSVFVNPRQFDQADDLAAYPRDVENDARLLEGLGAAAPAIMYAPDVDQVYPRPPAVTVTVGGAVAERLCAASRPGHFDGVVTVVTKLFNQVGPDLAVFGRKDRQQLQIVRRLVDDLDLPVEIVPVTTVRDPDGVAISSRNRHLTDDQRQQARVLSRALARVVLRARVAREAGRSLLLAEAVADLERTLATEPGVRVDYLEVVDAESFLPPPARIDVPTGLVVAVAAFVGSVRLIDNVELGDHEDEEALLATDAGRNAGSQDRDHDAAHG